MMPWFRRRPAVTTVDATISGPAAARRLAPLLRERSHEGEARRRLPADVASRLASAGMFRLCVPKSLGGLEAPVPELLESIEVLATADSAAAWCAMIGATTGLLAVRLPAGWGQEIYGRNPEVLTVGVIAPSGRATVVENGVRVSGTWQWGSGIHNADWVVGGTLFPDGAPSPAVRLVFFRRREVEIEDDWYTSGMRGTGSNSFTARGVRVPQERWASLDKDVAGSGPLYRFSIWGLLALGVAAVPLGIARRACDELVALAREKVPAGSRRTTAERPVIQRQVAEAEAAIQSARSWLYGAAGEAWETVSAGEPLRLEQRTTLRLASTHATRASARAVDLLYHAGGGSSLYESSFLQKAFRDVHVITQHMVVAERSLEILGRLKLGLETNVEQL